jgi:hypothetical protein
MGISVTKVGVALVDLSSCCSRGFKSKHNPVSKSIQPVIILLLPLPPRLTQPGCPSVFFKPAAILARLKAVNPKAKAIDGIPVQVVGK